jgi:hypothetical protein
MSRSYHVTTICELWTIQVVSISCHVIVEDPNILDEEELTNKTHVVNMTYRTQGVGFMLALTPSYSCSPSPSPPPPPSPPHPHPLTPSPPHPLTPSPPHPLTPSPPHPLTPTLTGLTLTPTLTLICSHSCSPTHTHMLMLTPSPSSPHLSSPVHLTYPHLTYPTSPPLYIPTPRQG